LMRDDAAKPEERIEGMLATAFGRKPSRQEVARLADLAYRCAELRGADSKEMLHCQEAWADVAHSIFNLKEFIYAR
ncbi:MAG: hypothetical protein KC978_24560, partial [Candidatus Omnitrophica bacterium]|nr:hypothetical protein [Candidatus Omnitrophota bacterium]